MDPPDRDDPRIWSIDRVVYELCHNDSPPWSTGEAPPDGFLLPERKEIEEILRKNHITGRILLSLTSAELRDDLRIPSLGQRRAILEISSFLRNKSAANQKVSSYLHEGLATPEITYTRRSPFGQSPAFSAFDVRQSIEDRSAVNIAVPLAPDSGIQVLDGGHVTFKGPLDHLDIVEADVKRMLARITRSPSVPGLRNQKSEQHAQMTTKSKKRLAPTNLSDVISRVFQYVGFESLPMQVTFYVANQDDDDQFDLPKSVEPLGLRIVVNRRMLNFYMRSFERTKDSRFRCRANELKTIRHRKGAIVELPSIVTEVLHNATVDHTQIENRSVTKSEVDRHGSHTDHENNNPFYDFLLAKYPAWKEDGVSDKVLPLYGDSDSENDYDDETWALMEAEKREVRQPTNQMTTEEVNKAIDEGLAEFKESWRQKNLPKVEIKAYNRWMKAERERGRQTVMREDEAELRRLHTRLYGLRGEFLLAPWHKPADVRFQCQSLELTLHDILEYEHYLQVLQRNTAPEKPVRQTIKARLREPALAHVDEESVDSDSDVALDDFIVDDAHDSAVTDYALNEQSNAVMPIFPKLAPGVDEGPQTLIISSSPIAADDADADIDSDPSHSSILFKAARKKKRSSGGSQRRNIKRIVSDTDDVVESDGTSDLDAPARLPNTEFRHQGQSKTTAIDLTFSDGIEPTAGGHTTSDFEVETPPLNLEDCLDQDDKGPKTPKTKIKLTLRSTPRESSSETNLVPMLDDVVGMRSLSWNVVQAHADRPRLIRKIVYQLSRDAAKDLRRFMRRLESSTANQANLLKEGTQALRDVLDNGLDGNSEVSAISGVVESDQAAAHRFVSLYVSYVCIRSIHRTNSLSYAELDTSFEQIEQHTVNFFAQVKAALDARLRVQGLSPSRNKGKTPDVSDLQQAPWLQSKGRLKGKKRKVADTSLDDTASEAVEASYRIKGHSSKKKKKKKTLVSHSQEVVAQQKSDRQRIKDQETRRALMEERLVAMPSNNVVQYYINLDEPLVYLNERIAQRVKPHQLEGIRFLWREIVADPKHQGCLLAHTMGLGKTMQVISLLVTIAECIQSDDPGIRNHIPEHLRSNRTLILCPPSLIDNWEEELLTWSPQNNPGLLGDIRKVRSGKSKSDIEAWATGSGILLMSYNLFQGFISPAGSVNAVKDKEELKDSLLDQPGLVIADEAHKMKNFKSKVTAAAARFKTLSRIALTGSPLNNHLEEYHTMVDWVAPGYLGTMAEFKDKYSDPIIQGLYADSSKYERRVCLRKLHVLKRDLEPKVNRADISAIGKDMPPKTEFFLTIPLTAIQRSAYDAYVGQLLGTHHGGATPMRAKLLAWVGDLILLCNHPCCFMSVYNKRLAEAQPPETTDEDELPEVNDAVMDNADSPVDQDDPFKDVTLSKSDISAMEAVARLLREDEIFGSLEGCEMSNRTLIVSQILEKAAALGDKTLIFSHSIPSLNFLQAMLLGQGYDFMRIDGKVGVAKRQQITKAFNQDTTHVLLISTKAGGLGLNLQGANRVILFDFNWNPMWEEQAVGRAYRLGQQSPVFVYRFRTGGTFEEVVNNKAVFKTQLFQRVVDKKNPERYAMKSLAEYLFLSRDIDKEDYEECLGKDPDVLDPIIADNPSLIRNIELTETFQKEDNEELTAEDLQAANDELEDQRLQRDDPEAWRKRQALKPAQNAYHQSMLMSNTGTNNVPSQAASAVQPLIPTTPQKQKTQPAVIPGVSTPTFRGSAEKSTAAFVTGDHSPLPFKLPQTDGSADDPFNIDSSSAEEAPESPSCRAQ